jgi:membrane-associated phospholipid phosphatase
LAFGAVFLGLISFGGCSTRTRERNTLVKDELLDMPAQLWDSTKRYVTSTENAMVLIAGGAASGYLCRHEDDLVEKHFESHETFPRDFTIALGAIPVTEVVLSGAAYLYSAYSDDPGDRQVWRSMLEAQSMQALYWLTLKGIAGNHSPNGERYGWPSGHTSTAVTFATVMNEYYGLWVGIPLYALSGFVMYERMETGEHWASDIAFGAAIGFTVGRTVAGKYKPQLFGMDVTPYANPETGTTGIAFFTRF